MADRTDDRSTYRPASIPPVTDDVDSGWPGAVDEAGQAELQAQNSRAPDAFAETPVAPVSVVSNAPLDATSSVLPVAQSFEAVTPRGSTAAPALPEKRPRSRAWLLVPLALFASWLALRSRNTPSAESAPALLTASVDAAVPAAPSAASAAPIAPPVETSQVEPSAVVPALGSAHSVAQVPSASAESERVEVKVLVVPGEARLFRHGKPAGRSGTVLTLEAGEKRFYEVVHPGYVTRKLVVNGSEREIKVFMTPTAGSGR